MKWIRCSVQRFCVDGVVDALKAQEDIQQVMVTCGGGWSRRQAVKREVYRGREYEMRLHQECAVDVMVADGAVDEVVQIVTAKCHEAGAEGAAHILVLSVDDWHEIRARPQRVA